MQGDRCVKSQRATQIAVITLRLLLFTALTEPSTVALCYGLMEISSYTSNFDLV